MRQRLFVLGGVIVVALACGHVEHHQSGFTQERAVDPDSAEIEAAPENEAQAKTDCGHLICGKHRCGDMVCGYVNGRLINFGYPPDIPGALARVDNSELRDAFARAIRFVESTHPDFTVHDLELRAEEEERFVVAVFYTSPDVNTKPQSYRLVSVRRKNEGVKELTLSQDSPYLIRGRK